MRISDWSSDVCSSDLAKLVMVESPDRTQVIQRSCADLRKDSPMECGVPSLSQIVLFTKDSLLVYIGHVCPKWIHLDLGRSEEHTSELQSLMRISYAVFCLKTQKHQY